MNQVIQAAICSVFKPLANPDVVAVSEHHLQAMKNTISLSQLCSVYGKSSRPTTGNQGRLFVLGNAKYS